ncbi:MAG: nodulation protein NfeD [Chloroflexota bacterium]|nr:MAG: nodulation protein NfeD [Chloroflexota bacterium]
MQERAGRQMSGRLGRLLAAGALALLLALTWTPAPASEPGTIHVARLSGTIDPITAQYLLRAIQRADLEAATVLVLVLDTPGGLDSAMRAVTQGMLAARVPVVVYVGPSGARSASAGMFLTIAAHVAAMAPGTNIGAAHPVSLGGSSDPVMVAKAANDAASTARTIAAQRGRNADWADRAVRESVSATEAEALAAGVIDLVARDLDDLLAQLDGRVVRSIDGPRTLATSGASWVAVDMTLAELVLHTLLDPNVAFLLLNLGFFGLLAEFYHPGTLVPGLTGVIAIVMGLVALGTLPVNWAAVGLLALAFGLFVVDVHVTAHGVLSVAGAVAFVLGGLLLFSPFDLPYWQFDPLAASPFSVSPWLIAGIAALLGLYFMVVVRAALGMRRGVPAMRPQPAAGHLAVAVTDLDPDGVVHVADEDWSATAEPGGVRAGEAVEIVDRQGLRLRVRQRK